MFVTRAKYDADMAAAYARRDRHHDDMTRAVDMHNAQVRETAEAQARADKYHALYVDLVKQVIALKKDGFVAPIERPWAPPPTPSLAPSVETAISGVIRRTGNRSPAFKRMLTDQARQMERENKSADEIAASIEQGEPVTA